MKVNLYSVRDKVAGQYNTPFAAPHDAHAIRSIKMEVNRANEQNVIYHNPADFALYRVGEYDHDTGVTTPADPELIQECAALRKENDHGVK